MRKCEWHCGDLKCDKVASLIDVKDRTYCQDHANVGYSDWYGCTIYRIPLNAEILAHLLTEELEKAGMRVDYGISLVAGKERALDEQDEREKDKAELFLTAVAKRWNEGDL